MRVEPPELHLYTLQYNEKTMYHYAQPTDYWLCSCAAEWAGIPMTGWEQAQGALQKFGVSNAGLRVASRSIWGPRYVCSQCGAVWLVQ